MKIIRGSRNIREEIKNPVLTLGNFDGVHAGHQTIFRNVTLRSKEINGTSVVFTFEPHPLKIIAPDRCPPLLTSFHKKMELIQEAGIDMVICADFNRKFADQHPREFAENILYKRVRAREILVGYDYTFGRGREGTIAYLKKMGNEFGFKVNVVDPVKVDGNLVSSSLIRELIEDGKVEQAALFLKRAYSIKGKVIAGHKKGTVIGYPTANIDVHHELIPHTGVYGVRVVYEGISYDGIVNVGFNPTFNRDSLSVEVHIFDFNHDIYGKEIEIAFIGRIREEIAFNSAQELVEQIGQDVERAKDILRKHLK